jgi:hypothetical protein
VIGGLFKMLAKGYVATADIDKLKAKTIAQVNELSEE